MRFLVLFCLLGLTACMGGAQVDPPLGKWKLNSYTINGEALPKFLEKLEKDTATWVPGARQRFREEAARILRYSAYINCYSTDSCLLHFDSNSYHVQFLWDEGASMYRLKDLNPGITRYPPMNAFQSVLPCSLKTYRPQFMELDCSPALDYIHILSFTPAQ